MATEEETIATLEADRDAGRKVYLLLQQSAAVLAARATAAEARVAQLETALGGLDAEDVQNMRDLMLKAERFYFGKAPDDEDIWVASRGPGKWTVWNGGGFVMGLDGQWVREPMPSSRSEEFIAYTRYGFADAVRRARTALSQSPDRESGT